MPNKYVPKLGSTRGRWTEEDLKTAINKVNNEGYSVRKASIEFKLPRKTLERKIKTGCCLKTAMGPGSCLGSANEDTLVLHIKKMQSHGFPFTRNSLRSLAYNFALQLGIKHKFNAEKEKACKDWLCLFLSRHPDLSIRKSEGVSLARVQGMNRDEVKEYFGLLHQVLEENDLFTKPGSIFNVDESGLQLNSRPGAVIAKKGSKVVPVVTSSEKGETTTVIACCNAEGIFLPPFVVMKGVNKKNEWEDNMPPGSKVVMSRKSAYVNADIFFEWLQDHFVPRKPLGKVMLILDGHTSHTSSVKMLEFAEENNIILVCLPSHTTHYLQPLDRSVFKSVKHHFYSAAATWQRNHPDQKIGRLQFGELLHECWGKAATPGNAISGFKATGIYPFNPDAIPDYAFTSDSARITVNEIINPSSQTPNERRTPSPEPCPSTSADDIAPIPSNGTNQITPTKILNNISPIPATPKTLNKPKKRRKIKATNLTSKDNIKKLKLKIEDREKKAGLKNKTNQKKVLTKKAKVNSDSSDSAEGIQYEDDSSDGLWNDEEEECVGCGEEYLKTKEKCDWIKCVRCKRWLHESCTSYVDVCHRCGSAILKKKP